MRLKRFWLCDVSGGGPPSGIVDTFETLDEARAKGEELKVSSPSGDIKIYDRKSGVHIPLAFFDDCPDLPLLKELLELDWEKFRHKD